MKLALIIVLLGKWTSSALIGPNRRCPPPHSFRSARHFSFSHAGHISPLAATSDGDLATGSETALDSNVDIGEKRRDEKPNRRSRYDPISDWVRPSRSSIRRAAEERVGPMTALTSPVFFSTDSETGRRVRGLSGVPSPEEEAGENGKPRAVLFVSNHQLIGIDSWMVVSELIQERNIHARSLVHPLVTTPSGRVGDLGGGRLLSSIVENGMTTTSLILGRRGGSGSNDDDASPSPESLDFLQTFGGIPVSPRNLYRLMETGQPTLLFPGGARESFRGRDAGYSLEAWPSDDRTDFVRVAAKFDATVVPFSSVGAAESAAFVAEPPNPRGVPFGLGNAVADLMGDDVPFDARWDSGEVLSLPLVVPKPVPARHGYLFHAPIRLVGVDHRDRQACREVYGRVKEEIREGIRDLLRAAERDPFKDSARRLVYERVWGKQAPTFPLVELNRK